MGFCLCFSLFVSSSATYRSTSKPIRTVCIGMSQTPANFWSLEIRNPKVCLTNTPKLNIHQNMPKPFHRHFSLCFYIFLAFLHIHLYFTKLHQKFADCAFIPSLVCAKPSTLHKEGRTHTQCIRKFNQLRPLRHGGGRS